MTGLFAKSFDAPDETHALPLTTKDAVALGSHLAARVRFEPGWKWSDCLKPSAGTESCEFRHVGVVISGRLVVERNGESVELKPGEAYLIQPGHDAWVVGDEAFVAYEFDLHAAGSFA